MQTIPSRGYPLESHLEARQWKKKKERGNEHLASQALTSLDTFQVFAWLI
jgi:hypothetical protein